VYATAFAVVQSRVEENSLKTQTPALESIIFAIL